MEEQSKCEECWGYQHPEEIRDYVTKNVTQEESDEIGWVTCAKGSTVRRHSIHECFKKG